MHDWYSKIALNKSGITAKPEDLICLFASSLKKISNFAF